MARRVRYVVSSSPPSFVVRPAPPLVVRPLGVTEIVLWKDHDVLGGLWWWTWETKVVPIKDCVRATLKGKVWIVGPVTCAVEVNGYRVWEKFEPAQGWATIDVDVTYAIRPYSDNSFSIGVSPLGGATWTLGVAVEWTGEPPSPPKPPPPEPWEIALYAGIAIAGVFAVGYLLKTVRGKS